MFAFAPLSQTLSPWPASLLGEPGELLDEIGLIDFKVVQDVAELRFTGILAWLEEIELKVPGFDAVSLALISTSELTQMPFDVTLAPEFKLAFPNLSATLRVVLSG